MEDHYIYATPAADLGDLQSDQPVELASRWARLGAYLVDIVLFMVPFYGIFYATGQWEKALQQNFSLLDQILSSLVGMALYLLFHGYLLHKRGQTIGKWVLGIKIVSAENSEMLPLWKLFFLRYATLSLLALIPIVGPFVVLLGLLLVFRKDKRCLHDFIAGSKVVKEYAG